MKTLLAILILLHGLIHLMGFAKAFRYAEINQLTQPISRTAGAFWGLVALLFCVAAVLLFLKKENWWLWAMPAIVVSQILIFTSWQDAKFGTVANVIVLAAAVVGFGTARFFKKYENEVRIGLERTAALHENLLTESELASLPEPVKKYVRLSGAVGKPKIRNFKIEFSGKIRSDEQSAWMPLRSEQYNFMDTPTRLFFLEATMKGLPLAGFHCFKNGRAFMDIRLLSLFRVQHQSGEKMDVSETVTFFNDMCCLAPATLVDPRIQWLETEGNRVRAAFTNGGTTIQAELFFNDAGELVNFISNDRYAAIGNELRLAPWSTPLKNYRDINGHRLPGSADAIYHLPEGDLVYATFETVDVQYNLKSIKNQ